MSYLITLIPSFNAKGLRRCAVPGVGVGFVEGSASVADFWRGLGGAVWMRVTWMGNTWSFQILQSSGEPIPNEAARMEELTNHVMDELYRWLTEDAADITPFDDY